MPDRLTGSSAVTTVRGACELLFGAAAAVEDEGDGELVDFLDAAAKRRGVSGSTSRRGVAGTPWEQ